MKYASKVTMHRSSDNFVRHKNSFTNGGGEGKMGTTPKLSGNYDSQSVAKISRGDLLFLLLR